MTVRYADSELRVLVKEVMQEQCRQELQIESANNELRRWKGLAIREKEALVTLQSQLSLSSATLAQSKTDSAALREEVNAMRREFRKLDDEINASRQCSHQLQGGLKELAQRSAATQAIGVHRQYHDERVSRLLEATIKS